MRLADGKRGGNKGPDRGETPLIRRHRMLLALGLLLPLGAAVLGGLHWRAGKLALLQPTEAVLDARPAAGGATGGVLLFGDSRVAQWQPLPERPFAVTRHGHSGESAIRLAATFEAALDRHRPARAILWAGSNDAVAAALSLPGDRDAALARSVAAFRRMAQAAGQRQVPLVILKPLPPIHPGPLRRALMRGADVAFVEALWEALAQVSAETGAERVDPLPLLAPSAGEVPPAWVPDSVHLAPQAYARLDPLVPETLP